VSKNQESRRAAKNYGNLITMRK